MTNQQEKTLETIKKDFNEAIVEIEESSMGNLYVKTLFESKNGNKLSSYLIKEDGQFRRL